ncbi:MAG: hypothetical protein K9K32_01485 [Halanaerobiales bacterium]|nr:hypothetical protein [Halanaerobiales bacterium]
MSKKHFRSLLILLTLLFLISSSVFAYQFGGDITVGTNTTLFDQEVETTTYQNINLGLELDNANFAVTFKNNTANQEFDILLKKAYIKSSFKNLEIKLGKQPVSWSFGSLINLVDFSLGAEALGQETETKYINAVELNYPVNWYSSLTFVNEFNNNYDKYGFRGRTLIQNFDFSLNYIKQSSTSNSLSRLGVSLKGDIGSLGVYSSYTNMDYQDEIINSDINTNALMVGVDYSFYINQKQGYGNRLMVQGEYHIVKNNAGLPVLLSSLGRAELPFDSGSNIPNGNDYLQILLSNLNYNINDFSSIGVFTLTSLKDGSTALIPNYSNQLNGNTTLRISGAFLSGSQTDLFYSPAKVLNIELSYVF